MKRLPMWLLADPGARKVLDDALAEKEAQLELEVRAHPDDSALRAELAQVWSLQAAVYFAGREG